MHNVPCSPKDPHRSHLFGKSYCQALNIPSATPQSHDHCCQSALATGGGTGGKARSGGTPASCRGTTASRHNPKRWPLPFRHRVRLKVSQVLGCYCGRRLGYLKHMCQVDSMHQERRKKRTNCEQRKCVQNSSEGILALHAFPSHVVRLCHQHAQHATYLSTLRLVRRRFGLWCGLETGSRE